MLLSHQLLCVRFFKRRFILEIYNLLLFVLHPPTYLRGLPSRVSLLQLKVLKLGNLLLWFLETQVNASLIITYRDNSIGDWTLDLSQHKEDSGGFRSTNLGMENFLEEIDWELTAFIGETMKKDVWRWTKTENFNGNFKFVWLDIENIRYEIKCQLCFKIPWIETQKYLNSLISV